MTAALEGGEWSAARPCHTLPPEKTRYPFYRRLGGPQGRSGRAENLVPTGIRSRTVQPVVSRYTDWATWPTRTYLSKKSKCRISRKSVGWKLRGLHAIRRRTRHANANSCLPQIPFLTRLKIGMKIENTRESDTLTVLSWSQMAAWRK